MSETILVIDDQADVRDLISFTLKGAGYRVVEADSGPTGIDAYHANQPDLILLDIGLGSMDGLEVCRQLRTITATPIIFLTQRSDEVDELVGFAAGGDDYITKPFSPKVVLARVSSLMRRNQRPSESEKTFYQAGPITLSTESHEVTLNGAPLELTRTEFDLLLALMENPSRVVTRDALLQRVWGEWYGDSHVVEVHISRLRNKVKKAGGPPVGVAVRGVGYKLGLDG